jgi:hypothetical protein
MTTLERVLVADRLDGPHGWIQWKGTEVCMDVHCECGHHGHIDGAFAYFYRCPSCDRIWAVGASVRLHALTPEEQQQVAQDCHAALTTAQHTLVAIGYHGSMQCYVDVPREEAIRRYCEAEGTVVLHGEYVREFTFIDTFGAYDVWEPDGQ